MHLQPDLPFLLLPLLPLLFLLLLVSLTLPSSRLWGGRQARLEMEFGYKSIQSTRIFTGIHYGSCNIYLAISILLLFFLVSNRYFLCPGKDYN